MIFLENCNFSSKEAKREGISLENLIFFTGFHNSHENCNFSSKDTKRECTSMENLLFFTNFTIFIEAKSGDFSNFHIKLVFIKKLYPLYIGYRPEFSFELK